MALIRGMPGWFAVAMLLASCGGRAIRDRPVLRGRADDAARQGTVRARVVQRRPGAARRIGAETVTYARNIYNYYLINELVQQQAQSSTPVENAGTEGRS